MNIRIHFKDFSIKDFQNVTDVSSIFGGDRIELSDEKCDVIDSFESAQITSIEIRP